MHGVARVRNAGRTRQLRVPAPEWGRPPPSQRILDHVVRRVRTELEVDAHARATGQHLGTAAEVQGVGPEPAPSPGDLQLVTSVAASAPRADVGSNLGSASSTGKRSRVDAGSACAFTE